MVLNPLSFPALWSCYALIILVLVNGTKGNHSDGFSTTVQKLERDLKGCIGTVNSITGSVNALSNSVNSISGSVHALSNSVNSITGSVNALSNKVTTITEIVDRCPVSQGYFIAPGTGQGQCLKYISGIVTWDDASAKCSKAGLTLARPFNAIALRQYLFERYGTWQFWVNARGNGQEMVWMKEDNDTFGREKVRANNPLWFKNQPVNVGQSYCMVLAASPIDIIAQPGKTYYSIKCSSTNTGHALCELLLR